MNLNDAVAGAISSVNPMVPVQIRVSNGYTKAADFSQVPAYLPPVVVSAQVQPLSTRDLRQIEGLNLQGTLKAIYIDGSINGVVRVTAKGGDLVTLPDCSVWLVTTVLEGWNITAGWTKAVITLQNDGTGDGSGA